MSMQVTDHMWYDARMNKMRVGFYMDEYLALNLMGIPHYLDKAWDVVGIVSGHGKVRIGKCQPKGTQVLMSNGEWKNIENIAVGNKVISPLNNKNIFAEVKEINNYISEDNYIFKDEKNNFLFECSGNHLVPIRLLDKNNKMVIINIEAKDLFLKKESWKKNRSAKIIQGAKIENFENVLDPEIDAYTLGVFLGDGSFSSIRKMQKDSKGNQGNWLCRSINITNNNDETMKEIIDLYHPIKIYDKKGTSAKCYRFSNEGELAYYLKKFGLEGKGSGEKFIPIQALRSSINYRKELLAGLIDTDGYVNKTNSISITTKSNQLAKDIQFLVRSIGGNSRIRIIHKKCQTGYIGEYYNVHINLGLNQGNINLKNKFKKERIRTSCFDLTGIQFKIEKSTTKEVFGITIDSPNQLYITDNFIVTHNSTMAQQAGFFLAWLLAGGRMKEDKLNKKWYVGDVPKRQVNFNLQENVVFSPEDLMSAASNLFKKYGRNQVIIYDEGRAGLDSAAAMTAINKVMTDFFQECGTYGHVILIVLPNFFKLHEDYAVNRSLFLIDVYADQRLNRGYFSFYNERQKEFLYFMGKKKIGVALKYKDARSSFVGRFTQFLPLDKDEYENAKRAALKKKQIKSKEKMWKKERDAAIYLYKMATEMTLEEVAQKMSDTCKYKITDDKIRHAIACIDKAADQAK